MTLLAAMIMGLEGYKPKRGKLLEEFKLKKGRVWGFKNRL